MPGWEADLDRYLTQPPEPPNPVLAECSACGYEFHAGNHVYLDTYNGYSFCDRACFIKYVKANVSEYADVLTESIIEYTEVTGE